MENPKNCVIGIDLGGTKIASALIDLDKKNIITDINIPTEAKKGKKAVLNKIKKSIETLKKLSKAKISAIGIGVPGPILYEKGIVVNPPNLPGWKKVNLKKILTDMFRIPVYVDNDANCAAYGEALFGAGKKAKNFIYITVSTGIGGGIIIERKIYRGKNGSAGEIGHIIIDASNRKYKCGCGNYGDLESMASGTSIKKIFGENAMAVHIKAQQGEKKALKIIDQVAYYLGLGITNLVNIFDPELIVVGGGLSNMDNLLLKPVRSYVKKHALPIPASTIKIVKARLGSKAGVLGAGALCL